MVAPGSTVSVPAGAGAPPVVGTEPVKVPGAAGSATSVAVTLAPPGALTVTVRGPVAPGSTTVMGVGTPTGTGVTVRVAVTPVPSVVAAATGTEPPVAPNGSVAASVSPSSPRAVIVPSPAAPGPSPNTVGSWPSNLPGEVSARLTVSVSPVRTLVTVTRTGPAPMRSGSVTTMGTGPPTPAGPSVATASAPPVGRAVAVRVAAPPVAVKPSR